MQHLSPLLFVSAIASVSGQLTNINGYSFGGSTGLCDQTFNDANSTGFYSFNPNVPQGDQAGQPDNNSGSTIPVTWGVTVSDNSTGSNASVQWDLWYSTSGANYSYDFALGYDVCAFIIEPTSENTVLRAQSDNGTCLSALDSNCVHALQDQATQYALDMTLNPNTQQIRSNLTADSTVDVCVQIGNMLQSNFPKECLPFLNGTAKVEGSAFTSHNESAIYDGCTLKDSSSNSTFHHVYTYTQYTLNNRQVEGSWYDILNWFVAPVMLTFMPIANSAAPVSITTAKSKLQCVHATHVNPGSTKPDKAPRPTPVSSRKGLSGGTIAGIVVGVVVGVALTAGAAFWFWRRKRNASETLKTFDPAETDHPPAYEDAKEQPTPLVEAPANTAATEPTELSPENEVRPELASNEARSRSEMAESNNTGSRKPMELLADVPGSPESSR